jgi:hypothetical protein
MFLLSNGLGESDQMCASGRKRKYKTHTSTHMVYYVPMTELCALCHLILTLPDTEGKFKL